MQLLRLCASLLIFASHASAKKILILPFQMASHIAELTTISEALLDKGHDVYMIIGEKSPVLKQAQGTRVKLLLHQSLSTTPPPKPDIKAMVMRKPLSPIQTFRNLAMTVQTCHDILSDKALLEKIRSMAFDFAIIDGIPFSQCLYILPYKLDVPYGTFTIGMDPCQMASPALPSFVPFSFSFPKTEQMTFWERLENTWHLLDWCYDQRAPAASNEMVTTYAPEKPPITINGLARRSKIWLMDSDIVVDYPRPVMPNEVLVGGLMVKDGKSLPEKFKTIVEKAKDGVIVMSFGSSAPDIKQEVFLEAFSQVKQTVLWRYKGEPMKNIPSNVHVVDWLPQADLLAHPNVKLFITHCGANGQFESVYSGVPMLHCPMHGDQHYNALRSQYHGFGLTLNLPTLTTSDLVNHINELINNPIYKEKVSKASKILKSRPETPVQRAVYWIEHVMTYGSDHLMAYSLQMPWYQLLMVDILAFVLGALIAGFIVLRCIVKLLLRMCCGSGSQKVKVN